MGLHSGMDHMITLEMAQELISQESVKEKIPKAIHLLEEGALLEDALSEAGLFEGMDARLSQSDFSAGAAMRL